ncbi:abl interactor 1-like [Sycon ciliatum]|uniref:abl interactor 1-like n=1 Tax=Sycon ciliatum TaxID=27933 RepID=UPI0031F5FB8D
MVDAIAREVPISKQALLESSNQLADVADYCEKRYLEATSEHEQGTIINESKQYTIQALASVAYSISVLAQHATNLFDQQSQQMDRLDESVSHLSTCVKIHKEKIVRRDIGKMSMLKRNRPAPCVSVRDGAAVAKTKYHFSRKKIDSASLDTIGFGLPKQHSDPRCRAGHNSQRGMQSADGQSGAPLQSSASMHSWSNRKSTIRSGGMDGGLFKTVHAGPAPVSVPVCPPKAGSMRSSASEPGIRPAVRPALARPGPAQVQEEDNMYEDCGPRHNPNPAKPPPNPMQFNAPPPDPMQFNAPPPDPMQFNAPPPDPMQFNEPMQFSPPNTAPPPAPMSPSIGGGALMDDHFDTMSQYSTQEQMAQYSTLTRKMPGASQAPPPPAPSQFHADADLVEEQTSPLPPPPPLSTDDLPPPPPPPDENNYTAYGEIPDNPPPAPREYALGRKPSRPLPMAKPRLLKKRDSSSSTTSNGTLNGRNTSITSASFADLPPPPNL